MLRKNAVKVLLVFVILFLVCGALYFKPVILISKAQTEKQKEKQQDPRIEKVANYKTWRLVNPKPVMMDKTVAALCGDRFLNPHADKYISVYVNEIGKHAMLEEKTPVFPVGTIIIKEKLESEKGFNTPELLTAMIKREKGFSKENGDWEFLVFNGTATEIEKSNDAACMRCHVGYKEQDYVVRNYLTEETQKKLK